MQSCISFRKLPCDQFNCSSKAVERYLCPFFAPLLEARAFGHAQFAYRKGHGARDAVLYYVLSWIDGLNDGFKIGIYCSDVSGAFDRVDADILIKKLESFGLHDKLGDVTRSWLRQRTGFVIVSLKKSEARWLNRCDQGLR